MSEPFGPVGIWTGLRGLEAEAAIAAIDELEALGYDACFIPARDGVAMFPIIEEALARTERIVLVTGILSIWSTDPVAVARRYHELKERAPGRFYLGLGVSHRHIVEHEGDAYVAPVAKMLSYLDALDTADPTVPVERRVLAALGPRMLAISRERAGGAHPYCTTPAHTAEARAILGTGPILAPELKVVLETDPARARAVAREHLRVYLGAENYARNLLRMGYSEADLGDGGSDRIVDDLVAWGTPEVAVARFRAHLDAGADTVTVQVLGTESGTIPTEEWAALAPLLREAAIEAQQL